MLDVKWIRENPDALHEALRRRGVFELGTMVLELERLRRDAINKAEASQAERNALTKKVAEIKKKGGDAGDLIRQLSITKGKQAAADDLVRKREAEFEDLLKTVPNPPAPDVPDGSDSSANVVLRRSGPISDAEFTPKQHFELGEALGQMDFEQAAVISGSRFTILKGELARLERALAQFMLDLHTREFGYTEVSPPLLVRPKALEGTGNLPKFEGDLFKVTSISTDWSKRTLESLKGQLGPQIRSALLEKVGPEAKLSSANLDDLAEDVFQKFVRHLGLDNLPLTERYLIPTAEVPLTNLVAGRLLNESDLPLRFTAWTPCFRSEAGAAGKDTRGMLRQHQFYKVELVSIAHPEKSEEEHERMTACAEAVLNRLGLPYRTVMLCTGDMGFASRKTYDIEVWLPGQGLYREISSCSNCWDFQARRMDARFRPAGQKGTRFVHTLNGSGIAVGRALIAVMENYQRGNGSIEIPQALRPYMGGLTTIGANG